MISTIFGVNAELSVLQKRVLGIMAFLVLIGAYVTGSHYRHMDNPNDKLMPSISQMAVAVERLSAVDGRSGERPIVQDVTASLTRIAIGVGLASICALMLGLNAGLYPVLHASFAPILSFILVIPALSLLPMLFIVFGVGEVGKIALIFIGTFPVMAKDMLFTVKNMPRELIVKAQTLGAGNFTLAYRVVMPMIIPRLITAMRLSLGAAWLFLIAAESISSTEGLGYRIFLLRRYMSMDGIIPYVMLITIIGFTVDYLLNLINTKFFAWAGEK